MERVQLNLERLLPELRDLEKKKIFTKTEISEIVKRRTAFETALIRKGSNERDWLDYIEYEKRLEQLRKIRHTKLKLKGRPTVSDFSISRHILSLYSSAVTRRPGSTEIWEAYITHVLRTSSSGPEISRVLARAISLHPTNVSIWLLAIRFEADGTGSHQANAGVGGGNVDSARKLIMRALRFMKGSKKEHECLVWVEWVRLEISFVERMRKRWEILGIKDSLAGGSEKPNLEMDVDGQPAGQEAALETKAEEDQQVAAAAEDIDAAQKKGKNAVLDGAIVHVVLDNAFAAFSGDVRIYSDLLALIRPLPTPLRPALLSHIYDNLRTSLPSFPTSESLAQACSILCRRHITDLTMTAVDGLTLKPVEIDSLEWIEAVGNAAKEFKVANKQFDGSNLAFVEDFAAFLADNWAKTEDASMKTFLSAHLTRLAQSAEKSGLKSAALTDCVERCRG